MSTNWMSLQKPSKETIIMPPVSLAEVSVRFTAEEWALLDPGQKTLFQAVMSEVYEMAASVGSVMASEPPSGPSPFRCAADTEVMPPVQGLDAIEEVTVVFSAEEWALLDPGQKALYWEVMLENYETAASLELSVVFQEGISQTKSKMWIPT